MVQMFNLYLVSQQKIQYTSLEVFHKKGSTSKPWLTVAMGDKLSNLTYKHMAHQHTHTQG